MPATLTYFTVEADYVAVTTDGTDPGNSPDLQGISALVTFTPNPVETSGPTPANRLILAPIVGRLDETGVLKTLDGTVGVKLVANADLGLTADALTYTVTFSRVVYDGGTRTLEPFRFVAPATAATINLASVPRLPA